jgi:hypothetical protein
MRAWLLGVALLVASAAQAEPALVMAGDLLLSRRVAEEIAQKGAAAWRRAEGLFEAGDIVIGNLEGAVGTASDCVPGLRPSLCFAIDPAHLDLARRAGFMALGLENNHAADLGPQGRPRTRAAVASAGLLGLGFADSPAFVQVGERRVGIVSFSRVADAAGDFTPLDIALEQKLDTARALSDASIAYVHWGRELQDWPDETQYREAQALIAQGADVVAGHHPHVVQAPACVDGRPVFFSLGNHVFDQKYPITRQGLVARCEWGEDGLGCEGRASRTPDGTAFPEAARQPPLQLACKVAPRAGLVFDGIQLRAQASGAAAGIRLELWAAGRRLAVEAPRVIRRVARIGLAAGRPDSLLVLEDHASDLDGRVAPRPYVYAVRRTGLVAQWRGTALAYPLIDAVVLTAEGGDLLCALHADQSFLGGAGSAGRRTLAYRWSGFGFAAARSPQEQQRCAERYAGMSS